TRSEDRLLVPSFSSPAPRALPPGAFTARATRPFNSYPHDPPQSGNAPVLLTHIGPSGAENRPLDAPAARGHRPQAAATRDKGPARRRPGQGFGGGRAPRRQPARPTGLFSWPRARTTWDATPAAKSTRPTISVSAPGSIIRMPPARNRSRSHKAMGARKNPPAATATPNMPKTEVTAIWMIWPAVAPMRSMAGLYAKM